MFFRVFGTFILLLIQYRIISANSGQCPTVSTDTFGTCVELCSSDADCDVSQKCCSNGCGHECMFTNVTVISHYGECPILPPDAIGKCVEQCSGDSGCRDDEKCCFNGCGHQCTRACIPQKCDCPFGVNYFNFGGCLLCSCKQNTCDLVKCPDNTKCQIDSQNIAHCIPIQHEGFCPSKPIGRCIPCCGDGDCADDQKCCGKCCRKACFPVACKCPYGTIFFNDRDGCPKCTCRPNPCDRIKCPVGTICDVVENPCNTTNCPPFRAKCVSLVNKPECKYGKPLPNIHCGRGGTPCPTGYFCNIAPDDRYAVCCPTNPCDNIKCNVDQICVLRDVVCVKAPCGPKPECISKCPLVQCMLFCENGFQKDDNGCDICKCKHVETTLSPPNPCNQVTCKVGERCILEDVVCVRAPCYPVPTCVSDCSTIQCDLFCKNGFLKDEKGCNKCECNPDHIETPLILTT